MPKTEVKTEVNSQPEIVLRRGLKVKRNLTIPLISMAHRPELTCVMMSEPFQDAMIQAVGKDAKIPPTLILVFNLDEQAEALLVVNALMASAFQRAGGPLTGRFFHFQAGEIRAGKNYRDITVTELEETGEGVAGAPIAGVINGK